MPYPYMSIRQQELQQNETSSFCCSSSYVYEEAFLFRRCLRISLSFFKGV